MKPREYVYKNAQYYIDRGLTVAEAIAVSIADYLDMQYEAQHGKQLVPCSKEEGDRIINSLFNMKTKTKPAKKAKAIAKAKKVVKKAKKVVSKKK